jgi:hypothetical protein
MTLERLLTIVAAAIIAIVTYTVGRCSNVNPENIPNIPETTPSSEFQDQTETEDPGRTETEEATAQEEGDK